jgi:hypothetical protein
MLQHTFWPLMVPKHKSLAIRNKTWMGTSGDTAKGFDHWSRCSTDPAIRREVAINGPLVVSLDHQSVPLDTDLLIEKAVTVR